MPQATCIIARRIRHLRAADTGSGTGILQTVTAIPLAQQIASAEQEEADQAQDDVEGEGGEEQQDRAARQVIALDDLVGDRAEDAQGGEAAGGGAVDDHEAHEERLDAVLPCEAHTHRGDDRDSRRDDGAEPGEDPRDDEEHPGDERDSAAHRLDHRMDHPVHGPVVLCQGEEIGDAYEDEEEVGREAG